MNRVSRFAGDWYRAKQHRWNKRKKRRMKRDKLKQRRKQERAARLRSLPFLWRKETVVERPNTIFSTSALDHVRGHVQRLVHRDPYLRARLSEERIGGIRDWEYGMLLGFLRGFSDRGEWRGLDVGSGNSTFPLYLVRTGNVAHMTTLDLPGAYERQSASNRAKEEMVGLVRVEASMLDMPFEDSSFDFVTCISAIEHLDGSPKAHKRDPENNQQLPYDEYIANTRTAVEEMARVLKPGGLLYLTTDAFIPERQTTDVWSNPHGTVDIWSAYRYGDIQGTFVETVERCGLELVGGGDFDEQLLIDDPSRATYRGRYFTSFALAARKREDGSAL